MHSPESAVKFLDFFVKDTEQIKLIIIKGSKSFVLDLAPPVDKAVPLAAMFSDKSASFWFKHKNSPAHQHINWFYQTLG